MVEKFDIEQFNKYKVNGRYDRVLPDGTQINEYGDPEEYYENIVPPGGWFYTYKEFHGNGNLKQSGRLFRKGDFKEGVWNEFDTAGNLIGTVDHNAPYTLKVEAVIAILGNNGVVFSLNDKFDAITREIQEGIPVWVAEWKSKSKGNWVEIAVIDDRNGKIIKRSGYAFVKN